MLLYVEVPVIFCQINLKTLRAALSETHVENDLLLTFKKYTTSDTLQEAGETRLHTNSRYEHDQFKIIVPS